MYENERRSTVLTEEDREDIAERVFEKFKDEFFRNVGKGVWRVVWKSIIVGMIVLSAYGLGKGTLIGIK